MSFKLKISSRPTKKFDIWVPRLVSDKLKKVSFGAKNYEDYTIHHDKERRKRYRLRHQYDKLDDPYSPGFWSYYVLWGNSTNLNTNLKLAIRKAKQLLK